MTSMTTEEFHSDVQAAEQAAQRGPVLVLSGQDPVFVMLTFLQYEDLRRKSRSLADALGMPADAGDAVEYDFPRIDFNLRIPDFD